MKHTLSYILFFLTAVITYGQVTLAVSEVKDQKVNQRFSLTVLLEISGENMQQETPLRMPDLSKFNIIGTASEQNTVILDAKKGNVVNQLIYQWVLSPKQAGKLKFGSVLVTVNGKIYKTEPFEINVRENDKTNSIAENSEKNDLYLELEIQDKVVYPNQPAIAVLRAYSKEYNNFRKVGKIRFPQQNNANIKPVSFAKSEIESSGGIASQVIGKFMIFPSEAGTLNINPVTASVTHSGKPVNIASNPAKINVKKLPAGMPPNYKNAVGSFSINAERVTEDTHVEVDNPIHIKLQLSGTGNLPNVHLPKMVQNRDYIFYKPKITQQTAATKNGMSGTISAEYIVIPKTAGTINVQFEDFSYFSPANQKFVSLGASNVTLTVETPEQIAAKKTTVEKVNEYTNNVLETVNTPVLQTQNFIVKDKSKINWKMVGGNLALLSTVIAMFMFVMRRKEKKKIKNLQNITRPPVTNVTETEHLIREKFSIHLNDSIEYLKLLKENKNFTKFFEAFDELNNETVKRHLPTGEKNFITFLEHTKGRKLADDYRDILKKIQMEKYAPFHSEELIDELYNGISTIFSDINK